MGRANTIIPCIRLADSHVLGEERHGRKCKRLEPCKKRVLKWGKAEPNYWFRKFELPFCLNPTMVTWLHPQHCWCSWLVTGPSTSGSAGDASTSNKQTMCCWRCHGAVASKHFWNHWILHGSWNLDCNTYIQVQRQFRYSFFLLGYNSKLLVAVDLWTKTRVSIWDVIPFQYYIHLSLINWPKIIISASL